MVRTLIANGFVMVFDPARQLLPDGFVAIEGTDIAAVGAIARMPARESFEEVIDATGCIVLPGLINMHQHHWYTLFKGLADGYLLEDWVANFLLPLSQQLGWEAMRVSSAVAALEMLATGTTCSFNHSVTTTDAELVRASIEPQCAIGIRQIYGKELRCKTPGNPGHPLTLDEALAAFKEEYRRWHRAHNGLSRFGMVIESNAHWVAAGMSTEEKEIGSLEVGKRADVAIFDLRRPYVGVLHRPLSNFICAGKGSDARAVIVNGEIVYRDGEFPRCRNPEKLVAEAERIGAKLTEH